MPDDMGDAAFPIEHAEGATLALDRIVNGLNQYATRMTEKRP